MEPTAKRHGLGEIVFAQAGEASTVALGASGNISTLDNDNSGHAAPVRLPVTANPNEVVGLGELVLFAQNLEDVVGNLARAGITTHKNRPPKQMKGMPFALATYFFATPEGDGKQVRLLVFGPTDPGAELPADPPPQLWMLGEGGRSDLGPVQLTGWLPVVSSLASVSKYGAGPSKKAVQEGRQIATLKRNVHEGLSGTFAFLTAGSGGPLF